MHAGTAARTTPGHTASGQTSMGPASTAWDFAEGMSPVRTTPDPLLTGQSHLGQSHPGHTASGQTAQGRSHLSHTPPDQSSSGDASSVQPVSAQSTPSGMIFTKGSSGCSVSNHRRRDLPIGLFDSGVGGLTVLAALRARLPGEHYCYLGDTARLPYGTKSAATISRYALQATEKLVEREIKLLVVACNTATAAALPALRQAYAPLPVIGVVEPGARAACAAVPRRGGRIIVMGTESTIRGAAYTEAIKALRPDLEVTGVPCSLFVSLAEEGWMDGPIAQGIAARYLAPVLNGARPDCIVLGCTHFPPLAPAIAAVAGQDVIMVDSAATTADAVERELSRLDLLASASGPIRAETGPSMDPTAAGRAVSNRATMGPGAGALRLLTTDAPERFARVGSLFLGETIEPSRLELVTL